jgi:tetratricopeptide (TPR) repeat protein
LSALALAAGALLVWQRATRDDPAQLYAQAAAVWADDPRKADSLLERAIAAASGDFPDAELLRCRALLASDRTNLAVECFEQILHPASGNPELLLQLAQEAQASGNLFLAERAADLIPQNDSRRPAALRLLVGMQMQIGQQDAALERCREWVASAPSDYEAHRQLARLLRLRRQVLPAIESCRAALRLAPEGSSDQRAIRRELIELLITVHDAAGARSEFDHLSADAGAADDLALVEAYVLRLEGRFQESLERADAALRRRPQSSEAQFLRGTLLFDLERYEEAAQSLSETVRERPAFKEAHYKLAQAYQRLGKTEQAQTHFDRSAKLTQLAEEHFELEQRVRSEPQDAAALTRLEAICRELGRPDEADYWHQLSRRLIGSDRKQ